MQDIIERSIEIPVTIDVVWAALTSEEGVKAWFGDEATIDLRPGGEARFGWSEYGASTHAIVEVVDRPNRFAFRWAARNLDRADEGPSTLVEFRLEQLANGTLVSVHESGLAGLPDDIRSKTLQENTSGWNAEMQDLYDYLTATAQAS